MRRGTALRRVALLLAIAAAPAADARAQTPAAPASIPAPIAQAIRDVPIARDGATAHGLSRDLLHATYAAAPRPHWFRAGRPTAQARAVVAVIADGAARGLRPADYGVEALRADLAAADRAATADDAAIARADVALTVAVMRFAAHLHAGRVDAHAARFDLPETHRGLDLGAIAASIARAGDVPAAVRALEPPYAGYRALVDALAHHRALVARRVEPPPAWRGVVRPGDAFPTAPALRRYLSALGDLPPDGAADAAPADAAPTFSGSLVDGVVAFQRRHGLDPDGVLGPATLAQLRVAPAARVRQIELTLERWRWLPDAVPPRTIVVNVPAFRLYALEGDVAAGPPALRMNVIVGQAAGGHGTPVFVGDLREVVFQPYWDVPPSIARAELLPRIRRDRGYLERESLEIVRGGDHDAVVHPPTAANLARVASGALRLRQRPGPSNALGAVKLVFPNQYNVYLHGTPATELFARTRRDFSHGCIRVEDPAALATWVLSAEDGWDRAAVEAAMTSGPHSRRVRLASPIPVRVLYATAVVDDEGRVHFYPDLYGHDATLARLLGRAP